MRRPASIPDFGELVGVAGAVVDFAEDLPSTDLGQDSLPDPANPLWEYHNLGTVDGWPVDEDAKGLPLDKGEKLAMALYPEMTPDSELLIIAPDNPDGLKRYNELKRLEADKKIIITGDAAQYDAAKSGYVVWIKYCKVLYKLRPRFEYLKEEK